jgi:hypothetical protein
MHLQTAGSYWNETRVQIYHWHCAYRISQYQSTNTDEDAYILADEEPDHFTLELSEHVSDVITNGFSNEDADPTADRPNAQPDHVTLELSEHVSDVISNSFAN